MPLAHIAVRASSSGVSICTRVTGCVFDNAPGGAAQHGPLDRDHPLIAQRETGAKEALAGLFVRHGLSEERSRRLAVGLDLDAAVVLAQNARPCVSTTTKTVWNA